MAMLELVIVSVLNPNLKQKDRVKAGGIDQFLPAELKKNSKPKRQTLHKQLQILAKAFGGNYEYHD
jgi:hypothetical protein